MRFPANMLPVVFTVMVQVVVATAQIEKWAGTITYPPFATNEVLNITMNADANTATIAVARALCKGSDWLYLDNLTN